LDLSIDLSRRSWKLYAGLPRGEALRGLPRDEALRGLPRSEALRGFRLGQIVQDSQKQ
jgi:hypothetical protein